MQINYPRYCFLLIFSLLISLPLISQAVLAQVTNAQQNKMDDFIRDVKFNDVKAVKKALEAGMSPNTSDKFGNTLLSIAIVEKSTDSAKLLINSPSIDLERPNLAGETPLMMAAFHGSLELVKHLINQRSVEINHPGWSALHYASTNGHFAIAEFLLDKGAYVDPESPNGTTALMMAARGGHITIVRLLLDRGADLSIHNKLYLTAIDFAEDNNQAEIGEGLRSRWLKLYNKPYPPKR
jgi:ankyrin repeat protein